MLKHSFVRNKHFERRSGHQGTFQFFRETNPGHTSREGRYIFDGYGLFHGNKWKSFAELRTSEEVSGA